MPITPCYAFFSTDPNSKLSKAIRDLGDGTVSHAGLLFWSYDFAQWQVLDATESGWTIRSFAQFEKQGNRIIDLFEFPDQDLFQGVLLNSGLIGVPYDWNALAGRGVMKWWHALTGRSIKKNHWNDASKYYCNEILAAKVFPAAGIELGLGDKIDMDPFQLRDILLQHPGARRVPLQTVLRYGMAI